jgi:hypothetical protein
MRKALQIVVCLIAVPLSAQQLVNISGRVVDDSTQAPVPNANIFIANSMMGTSSDTGGHFVLKGVPIGSHELVASCVGYQMSVKTVQLFSGADQPADFRLKPKIVDLAPVDVTAERSEEWKDNLEKFKRLFLGTTRETDDCVLKNPESLAFFSGPSGGLEARSSSEIIVDNAFLGYRLHVILGTFRFDGRWLTSVWKVRFEELLPEDDEQKSDWRERRTKVYQGSMRHFFRALIAGEPSEEGFQMMSSETGVIDRLGSYNPAVRRKNVLTQFAPNVWSLQFRNFLVVTYARRNIYAGFDRSSMPMYRPQLSVLSLQKGSLLIDLNGQLLDNLALKVSGDWGTEGLARSLPIEFAESIKK